MKKYYHPQKDFFRKYDLAEPEAIPHGVEEDILKKLEPTKIKNWRLEGNRLIADTELGPVINYVSTDLIMTGIDSNNLPILEKIKQ